LIEKLTEGGYKVVYANTDGVMIENDGSTTYKSICQAWENATGLELEVSPIRQAYIKDVNNYIVVKDNGELKLKGVYANDPGTRTSAFANISNKAVIEHVLNGTSIEDTVKNGTDIRDYLLYHKFSSQYNPTHVVDNHNGEKQPFERVIRYYLSSEMNNHITAYNNNTNSWIRKEHSDNISTVIEIPKEFPNDIDYNRYIEIAYARLEDLTGNEVEYNPYIEAYMNKLLEAFSS